MSYQSFLSQTLILELASKCTPPPPKNEWWRKTKLKPGCLKTTVNREQTRQNYRTLFLKLSLKINIIRIKILFNFTFLNGFDIQGPPVF
ncbi:hypothetical protein FIM83_01545 [Helicobacter pylori]|nr:hypothetical protein FIM83_01545 [Helicobacter pylori]